ncbi:class I SAM-dependent methyltransferase [Actinacidiphila sp. bgisy144]|uniref:class I SAM-dependent methyltransferase n=1 Tax=Actinacidiphila sp. bgisy144 TaxID=3413791 RepID=UPI003EC0A2A5
MSPQHSERRGDERRTDEQRKDGRCTDGRCTDGRRTDEHRTGGIGEQRDGSGAMGGPARDGRRIDRPADLDAVRDSYDKVADNYARMVRTTGLGDIRRHPWLKAAIDAFADSVGDLGPVLDVGCGPGTVTGYLAERGLDVSGVDLSPRMVSNARRLYPRCRFEVASATELDLAEASFGGLLGWWSLFNLPRAILPQVFAHFARALKPGGYLITATHVGDEDAARTEAYGGVPVRWTTHKWRPADYVRLIEEAGLHPVAELRLPADEQVGPGLVVMARRRL